VEVRDKAAQRRELPDTDVIFGRVSPELFSLATRLVYYHSIGAGVDSILTPHSAGPTWENYSARFRNGFDNIQRVAAGRAPLWVVAGEQK